jgi:asparagine synthase (glutamine-hydrolysing)
MCGILAALGPQPQDEHRMRTALEALAHRGPDGTGQESLVSAHGCHAWLGHTRLSILDLSSRGAQPMAHPTGRFVLTYNGEIYNYQELRSQLTAAGIRFRTDTDTEVLLEGWAHWGAGVLHRATGMFAFVLVDREQSVAYIARDHFGIKPLFYVQDASGLLVASEIPALLSTGRVSADLDSTQTLEYLRFGTTSATSQSLLRDVKVLPAAHLLTYDLRANAGRASAYWSLTATPRALSFREAVVETRERFLASVALHLRSDVPVGAALSGGLDSSAVVGAMRHLEPDMALHTFSYVAEDPRRDESRYMAAVSATARTTPHYVTPAPGDLHRDLPTLVRRMGEPFGSASIYAQFRVFKLAREAGVPVTLDGQGADELLAGYWTYVGTRAKDLLSQGRLSDVARLGRGTVRGLGSWPKFVALMAQSMSPGRGGHLLRRLLGRQVIPPFVRPEWLRRQHVDVATVTAGMVGDTSSLHSHLASTVTRTSLPVLLRYADRNSMAHSIESRVPFLTPDFAQFILSLPPEHLVSPDGDRKHVFREAMRDFLPPAVATRRDKIGFEADENDWLRDVIPHHDSAFRALATLDAVDGALLDHVVREFQQGRSQSGPLVWRALIFGLWLQDVQQQISAARAA